MKSQLMMKVATFALIATMPAIAGAESEGRFKVAAASTVRILALNGDAVVGQGTGWVVAGPDSKNRSGASVVVTAAHVLTGATRMVVIPAGGTIADVKTSTVLTPVSNERDIAFLEVKDLDAPAMTITRAVPEQGADVFAFGFNSASDARESNRLAKSAALKGGKLSKAFQGAMFNGSQGFVNQIEFDAPILPGYSGGPLVNDCGRAIGLTVKDGGHLQIAGGATIAVGQGTDAALAASEIIAAARDRGVEITVADEACAPPPVVNDDNPDKNKIVPPPEPTWLDFFRKPITLIVIGLGGLVIALGAAWALMRGKPTGMPAPQPASRPLGDSLHPPGSDEPPLLASPGSAIRITGRGPSGEPISMRFTAIELGTAGTMLGVEGDGQGRIPDSRDAAHVSRKHARLYHDGRNFIVEDNKSSNGTYIGGQRIEPFGARTVVNGDTLRLADVTLNVAID